MATVITLEDIEIAEARYEEDLNGLPVLAATRTNPPGPHHIVDIKMEEDGPGTVTCACGLVLDRDDNESLAEDFAIHVRSLK